MSKGRYRTIKGSVTWELENRDRNTKCKCLPCLNLPEGIPGGPKVWAGMVHPRNRDGDPLGHVPARLSSGWYGLRGAS